jgi:putative heme iron utilization protein
MIGRDIRLLMRRLPSASLATALAHAGGWPYASLVTVAHDTDGAPILLLSTLSDHTRNLAADPRASLLFEAASRLRNPQAGPRVTVLGRVEADGSERLRRRFIARHPDAALYADFADFGIYRMQVERAHFVGGFARAVWVEGAAMRVHEAVSSAIGEAETGVLAHMNDDHADAVALYARVLAGRRGRGWVMTGIDADGFDLRRGWARARLDFDAPAATADDLRRLLTEMAVRARGEGAADAGEPADRAP